eukprot:1840525-Amphidinium_carterae.1
MPARVHQCQHPTLTRVPPLHTCLPFQLGVGGLRGGFYSCRHMSPHKKNDFHRGGFTDAAKEDVLKPRVGLRVIGSWVPVLLTICWPVISAHALALLAH